MQGPNWIGQSTKQSAASKGHGNKETCYILTSNKRKTEFLDYLLRGKGKTHDLMCAERTK